MGGVKGRGRLGATQQAKALIMAEQIELELAGVRDHVQAIAEHAELLAGCARRLRMALVSAAPYGERPL